MGVCKRFDTDMAYELRDGLRQVLHGTRAILGQLGLRTRTVDLIVETWSGIRVGEGTKTQTITPITEAFGYPPKVVHVDPHRVALGVAELGDMVIGPITPVASVPWATITQSSVANGSTAKIRITHTETGEEVFCRIVAGNTSKALGVTLTVRPINE